MNNELLIKTEDAEQILHAHDGDCALLYLWSVFTRSSDLEQAAGDLFMTLSQVRDAAEKLGRMKLSMHRSRRTDRTVTGCGPSSGQKSKSKVLTRRSTTATGA